METPNTTPEVAEPAAAPVEEDAKAKAVAEIGEILKKYNFRFSVVAEVVLESTEPTTTQSPIITA